MSQSTARHALPFIQPAQAQKHVTHNEALERLDLLVQLSVEAFDASTPPGTAEDGQIWALGPAPSGAWDGQGGRLAAWVNGAWIFVTPHMGWRASLGTDLRVWSGSDWRAPDLPELQNIDGLGIQTSFDATNRLAVASEATLLTHDGAGHQLKINKNEITDTASLLFQTGWSGRAEMGTAGSDAWSIKVSDDGNTWHEALIADSATGHITIPVGLSVSGAVNLPIESLDLTSSVFTGQLPLTQGGTGASTATGARSALGLGNAATANILGAVSQSAGVPTGAVIQRGSNANGEFVRFADGTQVCWHQIATSASQSVTWTYPAGFQGAPVLSGTVISGGIARIATFGSNFSTSVGVSSMNLANTRSANNVDCLAIGRWF